MKKISLVILCIFLVWQARSQEERDYASELAQLEAELDSLSIFTLLDSVINTSFAMPSEISVRAGYSSNMVNAGRNYGIDQYGLSSGVSYYHSKGFYSDFSSFWNSDYDPMYTVSMLSAGYLNSYKQKISFSINYERWFYNPNLSELSDGFRNNVGGFIAVDLGPMYLGLDYSYLFNSEKRANRVIGTLAGNIHLKDIWIFDRISILPNVNMVYGNDEVTVYYDGSVIDAFRNENLLNTELNRRELEEFLSSITLTENERNLINQIHRNNNLTKSEKNKRTRLLLLSNSDVQEYIYSKLDQVNDQYGIMNYSFSLPISFQIQNWRWMTAYTYSIPISLPGEDYEMDPISYFTTSLAYRFQISSRTR